MLPVDLILVRHGESEGNLAVRRSKKGDHSAYTKEFKARHSSLWRLTQRGQDQARAAGQWIQENIGSDFDLYYVSEYIRAMETAALLEMPDAKWEAILYLRERDRGDMDVLSQEEAQARFHDALEGKERDSFFWKPPGGESFADLCLRVDRVFNKLHREADILNARNVDRSSKSKAILVCHGEVIQAFRIRLEHIPQRRFLELDKSPQWGLVGNGQIVQYTRRDPTTGQIFPKMKFVRSLCPWNLAYSQIPWTPIQQTFYSNKDLLKEVDSIQRLVERETQL